MPGCQLVSPKGRPRKIRPKKSRHPTENIRFFAQEHYPSTWFLEDLPNKKNPLRRRFPPSWLKETTNCGKEKLVADPTRRRDLKRGLESIKFRDVQHLLFLLKKWEKFSSNESVDPMEFYGVSLPFSQGSLKDFPICLGQVVSGVLSGRVNGSLAPSPVWKD